LAQRGYVMEKGQIVLAAPVGELRSGAAEELLTF
jgi:ABC-type branched-subunit amino acid transport system ATPase component